MPRKTAADARMDKLEMMLEGVVGLLETRADDAKTAPKGRRTTTKAKPVSHEPLVYWASWDGGPDEGEVIAWTHDRTMQYKPAVQMSVSSDKFWAFMDAIEGSKLHKALTDFMG